MDFNDNAVETTDVNFGTEIAKALILSAAVTVGTMAGFAVAGIAYDKFVSFKAARQAKKNPTV